MNTLYAQDVRGKRVARAAAINQIVANKQLSPSGADWLTARLDPYHDFNRPIDGYPDADTFDTIVSVLNYELDVSQPTALGANWDAHIFTLPFDNATLFNATSTNGQCVGSATSYEFGLVTVAKDASGGPLFPTVNPVASANFSTTAVDTFAQCASGVSRIIAMGIEVIDTTAAVYRQGGLIAYKMPYAPSTISSTLSLGYLNNAGTQQCCSMFQLINQPPSTVAQARLYRTSVQWRAEDGAYMVVGQQGVNNPFEIETRQNYVIANDAVFSGADQVLISEPLATTALQAPPLLTSVTGSQFTKRVNVTQQGIMLTGLNTNATFKVRVRVLVERAPTKGDSDLVPLSSPSAPYDYQALKLYSEIFNQLPVAVPVAFNAKGDWWRMIVSVIKNIGTPLGVALTPFLGPNAAVVGSAASQVAKAVSDMVDKKAEQKKQQDKAREVRIANQKQQELAAIKKAVGKK